MLDLGEVDDLVPLAVDRGLLQAEDGAVEVDVLPPGQFRMEAGADLQQAADAPAVLDLAGSGGGDAGEDLEQVALAGAVAADSVTTIPPQAGGQGSPRSPCQTLYGRLPSHQAVA